MPAVRLLFVCLIGIGVLAAFRLAAWPLVRVALPALARTTQPTDLPSRQVGVESLAAVVVERDPFRVSRRPAAVQYDPIRADEQMAPPAPKPALQLEGIVWEGGHDPIAVVEGLPGTDGPRVVRVGDVVAGLHVQRIARDYVRIEGVDTTWVLKVRGS
jgi:hypothetical protein